MIVSLTPNTTLDLTVFIPKLIPNTTIRATETYHSMGGKPADASWILGRMGVPSLALGIGGWYNRREGQRHVRGIGCDG